MKELRGIAAFGLLKLGGILVEKTGAEDFRFLFAAKVPEESVAEESLQKFEAIFETPASGVEVN